MDLQHHIIKRQVIDLKIDGQLTANDIQDRVSIIYKDKLVSILNKYLDTLSNIDSIDRINSLEIDLGVIPVKDLKLLLEKKLQEQLYLTDPIIISQPKKAPVTDEHLPITDQPDTDLVTYFLQTGTLPWWVKVDKHLAFENAVHHLLDKDNTSVISFFSRLLQDKVTLKRLIYTADDELLINLLTKITSRFEAASSALTHLYQYLLHENSIKPFRELWWNVLLTNTLRLPATTGNTTVAIFLMYFNKLKVQEAQLLKLTAIPYITLAAFYKQSANVLQAMLNADDILLIKNPDQQKVYSKQIAQLLKKEVVVNSAAQIESLYNVQNLWNKIRGLYGVEQVNYERFANLHKSSINPDLTKGSAVNYNKQTHDGNNAIADTTMNASENDLLPTTSSPLRDKQKLHDESDGDVVADNKLNTNNHTLSKSELINTPPATVEISGLNLPQYQQPQFKPTSGSLVSSFTETDRLYIPYSGLVLLWPFLERFFSSLGLISETGFIEGAAATKACLLLQYIAEGSQWQRFEPNLPLNKLLCGIDLFGPVDINVEITEHELAAADNLLKAIIANAPLWKSLTMDGLRRAYLQRDGILSSRDGNWLLQVHRQTYDILLDSLPWAIRVVKLRWMNNLIFVEWQQS